ncbi:DUF3375 domain-containing protein [Mycoavidus sp. SF9855]|uniref:DUF3375 domain-containing protein n=1 Tax=Mycoavidus sp. SF9855 TaxID=2968475 RepID=UPI00211B7B88|nr:DUF3375 domain-containing protein [Mycoavidus sp. SF9855]UUM21634.1 DUF3375 domain-containing protein [Mycoavidus sp. SF9855]
MDYQTLLIQRNTHPAWRLLAAVNAPLVASFLYRSFIEPNVRTVSRQALALQLEGYLYHLHETEGEILFPKLATDYLDDWAADKCGWLRKYYTVDSDEPHYDLTFSAELAINWLAGLKQRQFIGTESRLIMVFELLRQIADGTELDPAARIAELEKRKGVLENEIARIQSGQLDLMGATQVRERFLQMVATARELLADFRAVEQNFRCLDRSVRERIATWGGSKGELLGEIFGQRDVIADSDEGKSFRAFWDLLMSPARQEELSLLLETALSLEPVRGLMPDNRLLRIHYDWLEAGEVTQRTVARLSEQLRRYLDDQTWLENRRIMQLIRNIEQKALTARDQIQADVLTSFMTLEKLTPALRLTMERTLYSPPFKPEICQHILADDDVAIVTDALFEQVFVDKVRLLANIRRSLQTRRQISLAELVRQYPLEQGLAELVVYLSLATHPDYHGALDDTQTESVMWTDLLGQVRRAILPLVIFAQ